MKKFNASSLAAQNSSDSQIFARLSTNLEHVSFFSISAQREPLETQKRAELETELREVNRRIHYHEEISSEQIDQKLNDKLYQRKWQIVGMLLFGHSEGALQKVIDQMGRIGQIPKGYLYPELLTRDSIPVEL